MHFNTLVFLKYFTFYYITIFINISILIFFIYKFYYFIKLELIETLFFFFTSYFIYFKCQEKQKVVGKIKKRVKILSIIFIFI